MEPGEPDGLPPRGRAAGAVLVAACVAFGLLQVPNLMAQGFVWAAGTASMILAAFATFGAFLVVAPKEAASLLDDLGVPPTGGGASGLVLVLGITMVLLGLFAVVNAVVGLELIGMGQRPEQLFSRPSFALLIANVAANLALFVVAAVGYLRLAHGLDLRETLADLGFRGGPLDVAKGIGWALLGLLSMMGLVALLTWAGAAPARNVLAELITETLTFPQAIAISLAAALGEEIFFRGLLQPRIGLFGQAILFSLAHATYLNEIEIAGTLILGLAFGIAYRRTESLYAPIAGHAAVNIIAFAAARFAPGGV